MGTLFLLIALVCFAISVVVIIVNSKTDGKLIISFLFMIACLTFLGSGLLNISDEVLTNQLIKDKKIEYRVNSETGETYLFLLDDFLKNTFKLLQKDGGEK